MLSLVSRLRTFAVLKNNTFRLIAGFFYHLLANFYEENDETFFFFVFKEENFQVRKKHFFLKTSEFCFRVHISVEMHLSVCFLLPINNGFQSKKNNLSGKR